MTEFKVLYIDYPKVEIIYSSLDKYKENNRLKRRYISSNREEFDCHYSSLISLAGTPP
ncbi:hypothetical protein DFR97_001021 [Clostridium beijerinckii]|uniref:hypothetical protein n=1 Tax=Clostridium beijerinckii TaxID=1520 RepID=UPI0002FA2654|nr:hypothetical protein [Clostridium beijerinckii]NRZ85246.1 hypothetical protein [Clostridium beijerinckii]